jgi:hypothetical protein
VFGITYKKSKIKSFSDQIITPQMKPKQKQDK